MEKIKNLSLKRTIILYTIISLICSFVLSSLMIYVAEEMQQAIWKKYMDYGRYAEAMNQAEGDYEVSVPRPAGRQMSRIDYYISELCDFIETYMVLVTAVIGSCVAVVLFYKNKLQKPIQELKNASKMIAVNELKFQLTYENQDEMGTLCKEFEKMRSQLEENNRTLWRMLDDEKALRAAIAHDIRSPLSTLQGYQEMLLEFVPENVLDKDKILEMLREGMWQIQRIDTFVENMRKMTKLEDRELQYARINIYELQKRLETETGILSRASGKSCIVETQGERQDIVIDTEIVLEVTENLLSNALRYAQNNIHIVLSAAAHELKVCVSDDGDGFQESEDKVTQAFYQANPNDDLKHFGLGMYICKVYCEKHGGKLRIINEINGGGGRVEAVFHAQ